MWYISTNSLITQDHVWSFSALSSFEQCPLSFKLNYFDKVQGEGNGFSDYGTFVHNILDMYGKGIIKAEECADIFAMGFDDAVTHPYPMFPRNMREKAYDKGLAYFQGFNGFGDRFDIVSTEQGLSAEIGPHKFRGIIDLVLRDKENENIVIIDHKTKSAASMKREMDLYRKQLYLYALLYHNKYGNYPNAMAFNMINTDELIAVPFVDTEYKSTYEWAKNTIEKIIMTTEFPGKYNQYFCTNICGMRNVCPHLLAERTKDVEDEGIVGWDNGR